MKKRIGTVFAISALALTLIAPMANAQDDFARGEELFVNNKPAEAVGYLESAIRKDPGKELAYLYLGTAYFQLGKTADAISTLKKGSAGAGGYSKLFSYYLGVFYESQKKNAFAEEMYTDALKADPSYAQAFLNRANVKFNQGKYRDSVPDYRSYLTLEPETPQRESIERLIALLEQGFAEEDRLKAEEARRLAEEAARKAKLLEDVAASLKDAAEDTEGTSVGTEGAEGYDDESQLAD